MGRKPQRVWRGAGQKGSPGSALPWHVDTRLDPCMWAVTRRHSLSHPEAFPCLRRPGSPGEFKSWRKLSPEMIKEAERGKDRVWRNAFSHLEKDNHCHQIGAPAFSLLFGPLATASHWNHHLLSQPRHPAWNSRSSCDHLELNGTSAPVDRLRRFRSRRLHSSLAASPEGTSLTSSQTCPSSVVTQGSQPKDLITLGF